MSISILTGSASLICDGIDKGRVEYSIAVDEAGAGWTSRGKLWGDREATDAALSAAIVKLVSASEDIAYTISAEEPDQDGLVPFTVSAPLPLPGS